jgi:lipopolysaccharide export system permease protein
MRLLGTLDRYVLREWWKIFFVTTLGFPLMVIVIDLTDSLDEYLARGLEPSAIALSYVFSLVENMSMVLPAAVLFATAHPSRSWSRGGSGLPGSATSGNRAARLQAPSRVARREGTALPNDTLQLRVPCRTRMGLRDTVVGPQLQ